MKVSFTLALLLASSGTGAIAQSSFTTTQVAFKSSDGKVNLRGYLFQPTSTTTTKRGGMVMMGGRTGIYSSGANGIYNASTIASRHKAWARFWAGRGYVALLVDDYGSLGYPAGFTHESYGGRPPQLDEVYSRPLYAKGALNFLRARSDVNPLRIGLMGWSNGASTTLATLAGSGDLLAMRKVGFRAAVAMYPGCGLQGKFQTTGYIPYSPVRIYIGTADQEVSPQVCQSLVTRSRQLGGLTGISLYSGAEHGFDTPGSKQLLAANAAAKAAAESAIEEFVVRLMK